MRSGGSSAYYHYQAIRLTVRTSGTYSFTSVSSIDTYGYLYNSPVDPSYPSQNLITSDDDGGGGSQFRVQSYLSSGSSYVLIVTTFSTNVFGSFSVQASGPASIDMTGFTPSTSRPIRTTSECSKLHESHCSTRNHFIPLLFRSFQHRAVITRAAETIIHWEHQQSWVSLLVA